MGKQVSIRTCRIQKRNYLYEKISNALPALYHNIVYYL